MKDKRRVLDWFLPLRPFRKAMYSLRETHEMVKESFRRHRPANPDTLDPDDVRRIQDARERFEVMYRLHGWTESELREQLRAVRYTKITALSLTGVAFVCSIGAILMVPGWIIVFVLPIGSSVTVLCAAQAFRYALWEAQIQERSFIDFKTFLAMPDFWRRLFG